MNGWIDGLMDGRTDRQTNKRFWQEYRFCNKTKQQKKSNKKCRKRNQRSYNSKRNETKKKNENKFKCIATLKRQIKLDTLRLATHLKPTQANKEFYFQKKWLPVHPVTKQTKPTNIFEFEALLRVIRTNEKNLKWLSRPETQAYPCT